MMTKRRPKLYNPMGIPDPTKMLPDPLDLIPDPTRPNRRGGERPSSASVTMFDANIAANALAQGATAGGASVATPTERPLTENGASNPVETSTNAKRHIAVTQCENCGDAFMPRRPHGRFCSSYCRRQAWLGRNPEKAAELAERDRQRLREHVIGCGGEWVDRWHDGT